MGKLMPLIFWGKILEKFNLFLLGYALIMTKKFLYLMIGYLLGLVLGSFYLDFEYIRLLALFLLVLGFWIYLGGDFLIFLLIGGIFGVWRLFGVLTPGEMNIANFVGDVEMRGCIETEVDQRVDKVKYTIDADEILLDGEWRDVEGKVLINALRYPVYQYGDCFEIRGELQRPEKIEDFDYDNYLARYDVFAVLYRAQMEKIALRRGNWLFEKIYLLKGIFEQRLNRIFAEPYGSFVDGLILGSRKGIPEHLLLDFNTTGLTHIIAISGYNITLLIVIVGAFFDFLSRRMKVLLSVVFIFVFVILVGMSAAVVRAGVMGVIGLLALWFGRTSAIGMTMVMAAFVMNLWNPLILLYDVGFQLSFLATLGLVYVSPLIEKGMKFLPEFGGVREAGTATLSAQVFALPVILVNFGRLSLISPVANVFVLPLIPLAMFFGFFAVSFSFFNQWLGLIFGFITFVFLKLMVWEVQFFAALPLASFDFSLMGFWSAFAYYLVVGCWVWRKQAINI